MKRNVPALEVVPLTPIEVARLSAPIIYVEDWVRLDDEPLRGRGYDVAFGLAGLADARIEQALVRGQDVVDHEVWLAHRDQRLPMAWRDRDDFMRRWHEARWDHTERAS